MNSFSMTMEPNSPLAELLVNLYARAELAEAEAAALRARVAELEGQLQEAEFELAAFKLETKSYVFELNFTSPSGPQRRRYAASPLPDVEPTPIDQDDEEE